MEVLIRNAADKEKWLNFELENLNRDWAPRIETGMDMIQAQNKWWRENQVGMGKSPFASPEGVKEARLPYHLLLMKLQENPNILQDDKAWYKWLNNNPSMKTYNYNSGKTVVRA